MENVSTAQTEYFLVKSGGLPGGVSLASVSPAVVKNSSDASFYTSQGYPAPPTGAIIRGINPDGTLGTGNFIEITPAGWYINTLVELGDIATAQAIAQYIDWMTIQASFFGSTIYLVAGIAQAQNGQWVKNPWTVLLRNVALSAWGLYRLYRATQNTTYRTKARNFLNTIALTFNNIDARISAGELQDFMAGALYHAFVYTGANEGDGRPRYTLTWNRWTIEHLLGVAYLLDLASEVEGATTQFYDPQGNPYTIGGLLQRLGQWVSQFFGERAWIMRRKNPKGPYLPTQFVIQQAYYNTPDYFVGVNFDWTEESGTTFGDTWWVGDLELWGLAGMARLAKRGYTSAPVGRFYHEFCRLPQWEPYTWHDRYQFHGEPLEHDQSAPIVFTALYGLGLLENIPIEPPPSAFTAEESGGVVRVYPEAPGRYVVRRSDGEVLTISYVAQGGSIAVLRPLDGIVVVEPL